MRMRAAMLFCVLSATFPLAAASIAVSVGLLHRESTGGMQSAGSATALDMFGYEDPGEYLSVVHEIYASGGGYSNGTPVASFTQGMYSPYNGIIEMSEPANPPTCFTAYLAADSNWAHGSDNSADFCLVGPPPPPGHEPGQFPTWDPGTNQFDPLVFDLNGDGIHTTDAGRPVAFDINGDGGSEALTWLDPQSQDAFLWTDLNGNGRVDNGAELFGVGTILADGRRAGHGYEALAMYDLNARGGNADGLIDSNDAIWQHLRLWRDDDHDGVSDGGEWAPIHRYGVRSISLTWSNVNTTDQSGTLHLMRGTYDKHDPQSGGTTTTPRIVEALGFRALVP